MTICYLLTSCSTLYAKSSSVLEYKVKGAFLYNFTKFIEWPAHTLKNQETFVIGLFGKDKFGKSLNLFNDKTVHEKKMEIKHFRTVKELEYCHILFISASAKKQTKRILKSLKHRGVLTVGESKNFIHFGGIINFLIVDGKVRFEINNQTALGQDLKISSDLLEVAVIPPQD